MVSSENGTDPWVPVVDLRASDDELVREIRHACTTSGFFIVSHHGMEALVERHFAETRRFFQLPQSFKEETLVDGNSRGYTPMGDETVDPEHQSEGDNKEGLYFGRDLPADCEEARKPMHGPNQWPDAVVLPDFKPVVTAYFDAILALGRRLLRLLALCLDLPPAWFLDRFLKPIAILRPLHYSPRLSRPEEGIYGCGAHTDYGVLTLLATDGSPGLQIRCNDAWMDVPSLPGTIIVNLGDMLERWTSGKYRSTMHRVVSRTGHDRYSTAFFMEATYEVIIDPRDIPECCPPGQPPMYPPISSGDYLVQKYRETHASFEGPPDSAVDKPANGHASKA